MSDSKKQNYLHGAAILAFGVVLMKILGAVYKIPLGNILGDVGFGYFNTAYNVYNVFLTIATAGLPVALSRMISEANTMGRPTQARRTFRVAFVTFAVIGIIGTAALSIFHVEFAVGMGSPRSAQSILAIAPSVLFCCVLSAYRGFIQGNGNMKPTTVGQVLEVLVKLVVGFALAFIFIGRGMELPMSSAGAIFGVSVGSLVALIYMFVYKMRNYPTVSLGESDVPESSGRIFKNLMRIAIPITLGASVMSIFTVIDNKLVLSQLQNSAGFSESLSDTLWGVYTKTITLYNLPAAFITPLTISLVPSIAACVAAKKGLEGCDIGESCVRIASVICMPMGIGLSVLSFPIMNVVYPDSNEAGASLLLLLGIASIFVCLALVTNAILQAHGNERYPLYSMIIGGLVKVVVNWLLVGNPQINIVGAPVGTICCYFVMCLMNYIFLCRCMERRPSLRRMILRPLVSSLIMGAAAWAVYGLASIVLGDGWMRMALAMVCGVGVAVVVYLVLIIVTRAITLEDMKLIPKGEKLAKLLHIK